MELMTIEDVARWLGISKQTVYQWVCQRRIPYFKVGKLVRFNQIELERWIQSQKHPKETKVGPTHTKAKRKGDIVFEMVKAEVL